MYMIYILLNMFYHYLNAYTVNMFVSISAEGDWKKEEGGGSLSSCDHICCVRSNRIHNICFFICITLRLVNTTCESEGILTSFIIQQIREHGLMTGAALWDQLNWSQGKWDAQRVVIFKRINKTSFTTCKYATKSGKVSAKQTVNYSE